MKFKFVFIITFISAIIFSQDAYPYFSDPANQLKFEKKRIYIKEFEVERQLISGGGDEFNPLWLIFSNAPMFKTTPINTSFYYEYTFEIIKNGVIKNEIEFLQFIGLSDLANKIVLDYKNKFVQYQQKAVDWENNRYYVEERPNRFLVAMGLLTATSGAMLIISDNEIEPTVRYSILGGGLCGIIAGSLIPIKVKLEYPKPEEPLLKQHLTNDQIKAIAESHNRKVYKEILGDI